MTNDTLRCYARGQWFQGTGEGAQLHSAVSGEPLARASSSGLDFAAMARHAREVGGPALRALTFHERALLLKSLALYLTDNKEHLYALSTHTGATRKDSWVDIDGGIGTLFVYSGKGRRELPNDRILVDGQVEPLSKNGTFVGQHVYLPLRGVAVHINAYNFPCWGMLEKLAPALLAGVPAIIKPATSTAYLTELMFNQIIASGLLPPGAVQLVCGGVGDLLDHLTCQDMIAFTGSKATADKLRLHPNVVRQAVRFTAETDSLNCSILGPDGAPGTAEFDLYITEVVNEITTKAGQKCTAIRRIIVPSALSGAVTEALAGALGQVRIGNPASREVQMGALASVGQRDEVIARIAELETESRRVYDGPAVAELIDADPQRGAFFAPVLLHCADPLKARTPHEVEAFGPVATVLPYADLDQAGQLARMGEGSLVGSLFTADDNVARQLVLDCATYHGRLVLINRHSAGESTGHGSPMPHMVHGGPGRAGGGEELGGIRAVKHYMQRTALQGSPQTLTHITNQWISGAQQSDPGSHPFRKYFEEIAVGDTLNTAEREISLADIEHFAAFTGDNFYAHMDDAAASANPFFDGRVAHGYLIVSMAAGLFVDPDPGPVLANYGVDNLRFAQPVYPGDRLKVRLTCKQRTLREGAGYGEVRWDTEVTNQADEIVAAYDVLTMVASRDQTAQIQPA